LAQAAEEAILVNRVGRAVTRLYRYWGLTKCAGTAVPVEAEGSGEAEVLATTPEGPAETQGAAEAEAVAREHPAERERMGAAAVPGAVLEAGLVERPFRVTALPAPRLEAEAAEAVVAPVAPEGTGKSESRGPEPAAEVLRRR